MARADSKVSRRIEHEKTSIGVAAQVARYLGVEEKTVRNWTSDGKIPFTKVGSATRYRKVAVAAAFDAGEIGNATKWKRPPQAASKERKKAEKAP